MIFNKLVEKIFIEISKLNDKNNFVNLTFHYKNRKSGKRSFNDFDDAMSFLQR